MSTEAKARISASLTGRWLGEKSPFSKPVLQYTKDGEFVRRWANMKEVERAGITQASRVSRVARSLPRYHTAGGFVWKYESDVQKVMDKTAPYVEKTTV